MGNLFLRSRERRLFHAGVMFRRGRARVLWLHGVLYFGGCLFVLYNVVDYFLEPVARPTPVEVFWFFAALGASIAAGYCYGIFLWHQLERTFGSR